TVRRWCASGRIRATLLSRKGGWRIPASEVRRVLSGGATPTAAGK
ncbi:MAG: helix-turn-helix domain-containing protein, partial [Thermomicrobiales bacterium]